LKENRHFQIHKKEPFRLNHEMAHGDGLPAHRLHSTTNEGVCAMIFFKSLNRYMQMPMHTTESHYVLGQWYRSGTNDIMAGGHYAYLDPMDCLTEYCPSDGGRYFIAELDEQSLSDAHRDVYGPVVCSKGIRLIEEININELLAKALEYQKKRTTYPAAIHKRQLPDVYHMVTRRNISDAMTRKNAGNAATMGCKSNALVTGDGSTALTAGEESHALSSGDSAYSETLGNRSSALSAGMWGRAAVHGPNAAAVSTGYEGCVKGDIGCWLVAAEWVAPEYSPEVNGSLAEAHIWCIVTKQVDGVEILPDIWYTVRDGVFVPSIG